MRMNDDPFEMTRANMERLASIVGPASAAAAALREADSHEGPCSFLRFGSTLIVVKEPSSPVAEVSE